uniref:Uncharacterized protein n=1 Tax=Rhizophora mucronata TaxID=61149 RepID=A0A2P2NJT2_RHIMU
MDILKWHHYKKKVKQVHSWASTGVQASRKQCFCKQP